MAITEGAIGMLTVALENKVFKDQAAQQKTEFYSYTHTTWS